MNFLDTYGLGSPNALPDEQRQPEQSLNEEVNAVIGQLGRFWGGFKKQSQVVLETARKDLSEVVSQAQKGLTNLTTDSENVTLAGEAAEGEEPPDLESTRTTDNVDDAAAEDSVPTTLFSRIQAALPPNLLETARNQIPESLRHVSDNIDLPHLRTSMLNELQRVQEATLAQAEEYAPLIREKVREAGEVLRDAVKILPPEDQDGAMTSSSIVWDGGNIWSLPLEPAISESTLPSTSAAHPGRVSDAPNAVASRAVSLLSRLKSDPDIVRRNPAADSSAESYATWLASENALNGGNGGEWSTKEATLLDKDPAGDVLRVTYETLVPSELTSDEFWKRFFFRVHQIETEEAKRKTIIEGGLAEEEFSWEDDDDESVSGVDTRAEDETIALPVEGLSQMARESSTEGFDVVTPGTLSPGNASTTGRQPSSDEDSDWE